MSTSKTKAATRPPKKAPTRTRKAKAPAAAPVVRNKESEDELVVGNLRPAKRELRHEVERQAREEAAAKADA